MVAIGNPIRGVLHDNRWVRPPGNTDMRVTKTAAQHLLTGPAALDIGDGAPDLDDILAPHAGVVAEALRVGSANLSIDFLADGKKWRIVLAHNTLPHPVSLGQQVAEGQVVGRMGMTGATAIHLHMQLGYWNGTAWTWVDPWLYLKQNGATEGDDMIPIPASAYTQIVNKRTTLASNGNFRSERKDGAVLKLYPAGTAFYPIASASDGDKPAGSTSSTWFYGLLYDDQPAGFIGGWFHSSLIGPLVDAVPPGGHTDAELVAARSKGIADAAANAAATK